MEDDDQEKTIEEEIIKDIPEESEVVMKKKRVKRVVVHEELEEGEVYDDDDEEYSEDCTGEAETSGTVVLTKPDEQVEDKTEESVERQVWERKLDEEIRGEHAKEIVEGKESVTNEEENTVGKENDDIETVEENTEAAEKVFDMVDNDVNITENSGEENGTKVNKGTDDIAKVNEQSQESSEENNMKSDTKKDKLKNDNGEDVIIVDTETVIGSEGDSLNETKESIVVEVQEDEDSSEEEMENAGDAEANKVELEVLEVEAGPSSGPHRIVKPPSVSPTLTKNQMELLELEMRARAIKAMLNKSK